MRAICIHGYGGVDQMRIEMVPDPIPGSGEILVQIEGAGVNPVDWLLREGRLKSRLPLVFPVILGGDFAGRVAKVGEDAQRFGIGQRVFGYAGVQRVGTYAEYLAVRETSTAPIPANLDTLSAAGLPLALLTAYEALFGVARLRKGQSILIHAAAGGVGSAAVQLAKANGAYVIGTASQNRDLLEELGCDLIIDYRKDRFDLAVSNVDVVLDTIGSDTQLRSWRCLRQGGYLVSVVSQPPPALAEQYRCRAGLALAKPNGAVLESVTPLILSGKLRPVVDSVFAFDDIAKAHERSRSGHARGKIVLALHSERRNDH